MRYFVILFFSFCSELSLADSLSEDLTQSRPLKEWILETNFINLSIQEFEYSQASTLIATDRNGEILYAANRFSNTITKLVYSDNLLKKVKQIQIPSKHLGSETEITQIYDLHYSEGRDNNLLYISVGFTDLNYPNTKIITLYEINEDLNTIKPIFSTDLCSLHSIAVSDGRIATNKDYIYMAMGNCAESLEDFKLIKTARILNRDLGQIVRIEKKSKDVKNISIGHRRTQGLLWDDYRNKLWETEQGPRGGDELNDIKEGKNYGWPYVTLGRWYDMKEKKSSLNNSNAIKYNNHQNYEMPTFSWTPSIGVSQITLVKNSSNFSEWDKDIIVSSLKDSSIHRLKISPLGNVIYDERIFIGKRIRDLESASDVFFISTDDGKIITVKRSFTISENPFPPLKIDTKQIELEKSKEKIKRLKKHLNNFYNKVTNFFI